MLVKDVSQRSMMVNGGGQRSLADVSSQRLAARKSCEASGGYCRKFRQGVEGSMRIIFAGTTNKYQRGQMAADRDWRKPRQWKNAKTRLQAPQTLNLNFDTMLNIEQESSDVSSFSSPLSPSQLPLFLSLAHSLRNGALYDTPRYSGDHWNLSRSLGPEENTLGHASLLQ
uniref:Uncharacterized protein n=1 Tax=Fagus sylvatica TaxID=28930 RepID=A0A2N9H7Q4_FAGSY